MRQRIKKIIKRTLKKHVYKSGTIEYDKTKLVNTLTFIYNELSKNRYPKNDILETIDVLKYVMDSSMFTSRAEWGAKLAKSALDSIIDALESGLPADYDAALSYIQAAIKLVKERIEITPGEY